MGIIVGATVVYSYNELISIRSMKGAGSMPRKLIMCGNHPVLTFEYDPESGHACSSGEVLDPMRLPLEFTMHGKSALYAKRIAVRQKNRCTPKESTNGGSPVPFPPRAMVSAVYSNPSARRLPENCSTGPTD